MFQRSSMRKVQATMNDSAMPCPDLVSRGKGVSDLAK